MLNYLLQLPIDTSEVPCYWETQPTGCVKINCPYKHSKPRPQGETATAGKSSLGCY